VPFGLGLLPGTTVWHHGNCNLPCRLVVEPKHGATVLQFCQTMVFGQGRPSWSQSRRRMENSVDGCSGECHKSRAGASCPTTQAHPQVMGSAVASNKVPRNGGRRGRSLTPSHRGRTPPASHIFVCRTPPPEGVRRPGSASPTFFFFFHSLKRPHHNFFSRALSNAG